MAYVGKFIDKASYRTYCLMGDGESMEGNVWEAINFAGYYKLDNLCAIIDVNRLGMYDLFSRTLLKFVLDRTGIWIGDHRKHTSAGYGNFELQEFLPKK